MQNSSTLPSTRSLANSDHNTIEHGAERLCIDGYCVIPELLPERDVIALDAALAPDFDATPFCEGRFYGERTKRFGQLLVRSPAAVPLVAQARSPAEHLALRPLLHPEEAAECLRAKIMHCVPRAVPEGQDCFLMISGGLDSALVAVALGAAGWKFTGINFATRGPEGNERAYISHPI